MGPAREGHAGNAADAALGITNFEGRDPKLQMRFLVLWRLVNKRHSDQSLLNMLSGLSNASVLGRHRNLTDESDNRR